MPAPLLAAMAPAMGQAAGSIINSGKGQAAALAPLTLGTAIYQMNADKQLQKRNKRLLDELLNKEASGNLGLGGAERESMAAAAMNPIANALQQQQRRADAAMTSRQMTSGADLAAARDAQAGMMGSAAQQIAAQVYAADQAEAERQKQEIEARMALKAQMRRDDAGLITGALASFAGATGAAAGSAPGTFEAAGMFGKLGKSDAAMMREFMEKYPDEFAKMYEAEAAARAAAAAPADAAAAAAPTVE